MTEGEPKYDGLSDRFYYGDQPVPRSDREAEEMGLHYDRATNAWWSGDTMVCSQDDIDRWGDGVGNLELT